LEPLSSKEVSIDYEYDTPSIERFDKFDDAFYAATLMASKTDENELIDLCDSDDESKLEISSRIGVEEGKGNEKKKRKMQLMSDQIRKLQKQLKEIEKPCKSRPVSYGESHDNAHRLLKIEMNNIFGALIKSKKLQHQRVLVMDDDESPCFGTTRVLVEQYDITKIVCVNNNRLKCRVLKKKATAFKGMVTVHCDDAVEFVTKTPDIHTFGAFYFDFCGHVDHSVNAVNVLRARRPCGSYIMGLTFTTQHDADALGAYPMLLDAIKGYPSVGGSYYKSAQMHTRFFWVPEK
jgi:hypothetical protein